MTINCGDKKTSIPPIGYIPEPGDPSPPWSVLTGLRANNPPFGSNAILVCPNPSTPEDEPYWEYFYPG